MLSNGSFLSRLTAPTTYSVNMQTATQSSLPVRTVIGLAAGMLLILGLAGCGEAEDDYEGTYRGSSGNSLLILEPEGRAAYTQERSTGGPSADSGTWHIEDDMLIVDVENLRDEIYADIADSPENLLFESENSLWNDEIFSKE